MSPIILSVDDDEEDQMLFTEAFADKALDCRLVCVTNGPACFRYLSQTIQLPALILLDLNLPGMNGFEILRQLRIAPQWKSIPVVVLSTTRSEEQINQVYGAGANSFLTKPNDFKDLIHMAGVLCSDWLTVIKRPANVSGDEIKLITF